MSRVHDTAIAVGHGGEWRDTACPECAGMSQRMDVRLDGGVRWWFGDCTDTCCCLCRCEIEAAEQQAMLPVTMEDDE